MTKNELVKEVILKEVAVLQAEIKERQEKINILLQEIDEKPVKISVAQETQSVKHVGAKTPWKSIVQDFLTARPKPIEIKDLITAIITDLEITDKQMRSSGQKIRQAVAHLQEDGVVKRTDTGGKIMIQIAEAGGSPDKWPAVLKKYFLDHAGEKILYKDLMEAIGRTHDSRSAISLAMSSLKKQGFIKKLNNHGRGGEWMLNPKSIPLVSRK